MPMPTPGSIDGKFRLTPGPLRQYKQRVQAAALVADRVANNEAKLVRRLPDTSQRPEGARGGGADHGLVVDRIRESKARPVATIPVADERCCPSGPGRYPANSVAPRIPPATGFGRLKFRSLNLAVWSVRRHDSWYSESPNSASVCARPSSRPGHTPGSFDKRPEGSAAYPC